MRRRSRVDLGGGSTRAESRSQEPNGNKDEARLERKRKRWATVNKHRPAEDNPFLAAIKPDNDNYGDPDESAEQLRARLESLEFGNYPGYFNYRNKAAAKSTTPIGRELPAKTQETVKDESQQSKADSLPLEFGLGDERLSSMKENWFKDKEVLDVGCNRGHVTYAIAKLFSPKFILGIDIDLKLIHMANRDLHLHLESHLLKANLDFRIKRAYELSRGDDPGEAARIAQTEACIATSNPVGDADHNNGVNKTSNEDVDRDLVYIEDEKQHFTLSSYVAQGPLALSIPSSVERVVEPSDSSKGQLEESEADQKAHIFPNNILFVEHNYVLARDELVANQRAHFDTILCLSVTKWIHLNYRDEGLKRFFKRMYNHLRPGGLLVLEAQPFDNYHRKKRLSESLRANFQSIRFKPEHFDEFLLSEEVGFKQILYSTTTEHECAGFKRPMKVFLK